MQAAVLSMLRSGRLRWLGPWLPRMTLGGRHVKRTAEPFGFRWGWVLLLSIAIVLAMGECTPAASAAAAIP
jgi:hypothetical protein